MKLAKVVSVLVLISHASSTEKPQERYDSCMKKLGRSPMCSASATAEQIAMCSFAFASCTDPSGCCTERLRTCITTHEDLSRSSVCDQPYMKCLYHGCGDRNNNTSFNTTSSEEFFRGVHTSKNLLLGLPTTNINPQECKNDLCESNFNDCADRVYLQSPTNASALATECIVTFAKCRDDDDITEASCSAPPVITCEDGITVMDLIDVCHDNLGGYLCRSNLMGCYADCPDNSTSSPSATTPASTKMTASGSNSATAASTSSHATYTGNAHNLRPTLGGIVLAGAIVFL